MKLTDNGCCYSVNLSAADVADWAQNWPCFGTPRAVWFQFERETEDLVDMSNTTGIDDGAILALSHDAQEWADKKLTWRQIVERNGS